MLTASFRLFHAIFFALLVLHRGFDVLETLDVILLRLEQSFSLLVLLHLLELSRAFLFHRGEFFGATKHDTAREFSAWTIHSHQTLLLGAFSLPLGSVLGRHGDLLLGVILLVIHGAFVVRLFDERNALFALGALQVIHALGERVELALLLLASLDLLLDGF